MTSISRILACRRISLVLSRQYHTRRTAAPTSPEVSRLLENYAQTPGQPLTLASLLSYAQPVTEDSILASVAYIQKEIPRRLAARITSLQALPYIVGTNPYIARTLSAYRDSFTWIAQHDPVTSLEENVRFTAQLAELVQSHAHDIPTMARGFQECTRYMPSSAISDFLDAAIRNRIDVRLLAEEHIAISHTPQPDSRKYNDRIGVVHTRCSPSNMIEIVGSFVSDLCEATLGGHPKIHVDGHADATFSYIPVHLEYILTELLKNAFRATMEHHYKLHGDSSSEPIPPVIITIVRPPDNLGMSSRSFLSMRIRDQGGGIPTANLSRVFSYAFTTAGRNVGDDGGSDLDGGPYAAQHIGGSAAVGSGSPGEGSLFSDIASKGLQTGLGTIAGLGYGLPMSKLYAGYFGGSLALHSLEGWGTDCVLKLPTLDKALDCEI